MSIETFLTSGDITFDKLLAKVDDEHQGIKQLIRDLYKACNTSPQNSDDINGSMNNLQVAYTSLNLDTKTYLNYEDAKDRIQSIFKVDL
jgi:sulfur relay (sulfurtransferase) DsrC/TusE family protein